MKKTYRKHLKRGGNRTRKTVIEILRNSGAFGNIPKTKKDKRKQITEIEKLVVKENKELYMLNKNNSQNKD